VKNERWTGQIGEEKKKIASEVAREIWAWVSSEAIDWNLRREDLKDWE